NLTAPTMHDGSQPLVLWKDRQYADTRFDYVKGSAFYVTKDYLAPGTPAEPFMAIPTRAWDVKDYEAGYKRFCEVFPDLMMVTERAIMYLDPNNPESKLPGRWLNAGFHSQSGYFRDDQPLCKYILTDEQNKQLDKLWQELHFVASDISREY